ncbi:hypothetical protein APSETT445_003808 [Aspergillus pseudonomiae]
MHLGGPAVPEEADGYQEAPWDERRESEFWLRLAIVSGDEAILDPVGKGAEAGDTNEGSDTNADVHESGGALTEMVGGFVYLRDRGEEQVEIAENHAYGHPMITIRAAPEIWGDSPVYRENKATFGQPENPSPALCFGKVATCDRPNDGAQERAQPIDGHGDSTLLSSKHVRDRARAQGDRTAAGNPSEQAKDEKRTDVRGESACDIPDRKD